MIEAVRAVVHRDATAQEAYDLYREQKDVRGDAVCVSDAGLADERKV
jgi:hypothetical protein